MDDLLRTGRMVPVEEPVDSNLVLAAVQRRVFEMRGPALYFSNVYHSYTRIDGEIEKRNCDFPLVCNLYGTKDRLEFIFRGAIEPLKKIMSWGTDPFAELASFSQRRWNWTRPWKELRNAVELLKTSNYARPKFVKHAAVLQHETTLDRLPQLICWPRDGGPFITLPLVYTEHPRDPGVLHSNLGMYRVQIAGKHYRRNLEAGMHYQIHRGIAAHHAAAIECEQPLAVNIFIGGAPSMTLAAIMPLPENVSELTFAGMLGKHRIPMMPPDPGDSTRINRLPIYAEADFCLCGYLDRNRLAPEGPFGDHLGYYSLEHEFPVLNIEKVFHRADAIWPFTVVGRPPQEDTMFGEFIHDLTGSLVPKKVPGVHAVRAVDEAGVHPLLLAIGSERYHPYETPEKSRAAELHTIAHAILGYGQLSLAKYLFLVAKEDDPGLSLADAERFFMHVLSRVDWSRDLHFTTCTNMDTLDYSGGILHRGSKLAVCVAGRPVRELPHEIDEEVAKSLNELETHGLKNAKFVSPGILALDGDFSKEELLAAMDSGSKTDSLRAVHRFPLLVRVDEVRSLRTFRDFLWTTFTKSDPANDVYGIGAFCEQKHWGCTGPLLIDATRKAHHAPELHEPPQIAEKADRIVRGIMK